MRTKLIENSHVLVTGGAGFIGSNLVDKLLDQKNKVVCLDNFSSGKKTNLVKALANADFILIEGDIRSGNDCRKAIEGCEYVIHNANQGSISQSIEDPAGYAETNIIGFINILHAAVKEGVKRLVYASSSRVYGDNITLPKIEHELGRMLSPYALYKSVNEQFAQHFSESYGIETIGLRYFNVYGKRQNVIAEYDTIVPQFMQTFLSNNELQVHGNGQDSRDFTYIDDVLNAIQQAITKPTEEIRKRQMLYYNIPKIPRKPYYNGTISDVFNISLGSRTSIGRLASIIREKLAYYSEDIRNLEITFTTDEENYISHSLASIEKAKTILEFYPYFDINTGITHTAKWYVKNSKTKLAKPLSSYL